MREMEIGEWIEKEHIMKQREIKFRAWDKEAEMMRNHITDLCYVNDSNNFALMQYTGLHDKNSKEIYEGDIVKLTESEFIYEVKFPQMFNLIGENHEIIGNIYQNPELIHNK